MPLRQARTATHDHAGRSLTRGTHVMVSTRPPRLPRSEPRPPPRPARRRGRWPKRRHPSHASVVSATCVYVAACPTSLAACSGSGLALLPPHRDRRRVRSHERDCPMRRRGSAGADPSRDRCRYPRWRASQRRPCSRCRLWPFASRSPPSLADRMRGASCRPCRRRGGTSSRGTAVVEDSTPVSPRSDRSAATGAGSEHREVEHLLARPRCGNDVGTGERVLRHAEDRADERQRLNNLVG